MSMFNQQRLNKEVFQIDAPRMRKGWYSDEYFNNNAIILSVLASEGYEFAGHSDIFLDGVVKTGEIEVEMQFFARRKPFSLVGGVDESLAILEECAGYFDDQDNFISAFNNLEIEAVEDGTFVYYDGDPGSIQPVLKVRGQYKDIARLETPILGALTETTRIATNVYNALVATKGKDILFFPARFAHYKLQALHGYAYSLAVQAYNVRHNKNSKAFVSTDDQGGWWGGKGGGTIAHASIACFLGDTAETMMQFSRIMPINVPRIALIDFHNDCVNDTLLVMEKMFMKYWELYKKQDPEANRYKLYAVRPDTSGNMRDKALVPLGVRELDFGVNPRLVWTLRQAIDKAYQDWSIPFEALEIAKTWCKEVKIVVTGGFNADKIKTFEDLKVPVDIYGVGSSLLENSSETNNDYTADIVRVKIDGHWIEMHKAGRQSGFNPNLKTII